MKILFLGGTGIISTACTRLAVARGFDVTLLNRSNREGIPGARQLKADLTRPAEAAAALAGRTWDAVVDFIAFDRAAVEQRLELFRGRTGPLRLFYKVGPSPSEWWGMTKTSTDDGKTWSAAEKLPAGILGPIKNKPVQLANGDILAGSSTENNGWQVHFERSTDGRAWTSTPPINDGRTIGAIQPSILVHKDGRLEAVGRTRQGKVFATWSSDQGKTWGPLELLDLPNPNAGIDAVTLKDGRFVMVYNHTASGRSPLNVAVSADGKNWTPVLVLEDEPGREFSYPAVIQTSDGKVHVTYTWRRQRIKHAVIDITGTTGTTGKIGRAQV